MILWQSQFHMNHLKIQQVAFKEKKTGGLFLPNRPFFNQLYDAGLGM